jgi:hypothetical protein
VRHGCKKQRQFLSVKTSRDIPEASAIHINKGVTHGKYIHVPRVLWQYAAVTGRKRPTPYTSLLAGLAESTRLDARNTTLDTLRQEELAQTQRNFDAGQAAEQERLSIAKQEATKGTLISGAQTALGGAYLADKVGIINLKEIAGSILPGKAAATSVPSAYAGSFYTPAMAEGITGSASTAPVLASKYLSVTGAAGIPSTAGAGALAADSTAAGGAFSVDASLAPAAVEGTASLAGSAAPGAFAVDASLAPGAAASSGTAGTTGAIAASYALPALAAYAAPKLIDAIHEDSMENLGHNLSLRLVRDEQTAKTVGSSATGAAAGALTGAAIGAWGGPIGAGTGAVIGAIAGAVSGGCIIVTCCTHRDSPEVQITRAYRDHQ